MVDLDPLPGAKYHRVGLGPRDGFMGRYPDPWPPKRADNLEFTMDFTIENSDLDIVG